jgi:hypothetical protein
VSALLSMATGVARHSGCHGLGRSCVCSRTSSSRTPQCVSPLAATSIWRAPSPPFAHGRHESCYSSVAQDIPAVPCCWSKWETILHSQSVGLHYMTQLIYAAPLMQFAGHVPQHIGTSPALSANHDRYEVMLLIGMPEILMATMYHTASIYDRSTSKQMHVGAQGTPHANACAPF